MACRAAQLAGHPLAFLTAVTLVLVWALSGPLFGYSDTWQLVINTSTTIVTFLMVFLIQHTQNRDTLAAQLKLAELIIAVKGAENRLATAEDLSEKDLEDLHEDYRQRAEETLDPDRRRQLDRRVDGDRARADPDILAADSTQALARPRRTRAWQRFSDRSCSNRSRS